MKPRVQILLLTAAVSLTGCSAALRVERVVGSPPEKAPGLVVNQAVPHDVIAVFPTSPRGKSLATKHARAMLPSQREYYVIGYRGALFRSNSLQIELHPDTTVRKVAVTSDLQAAEALGELSKAAESVGALKEALKKPDPLDVENATLQQELLNLMLLENKKAAEKGDELPYEDLDLTK